MNDTSSKSLMQIRDTKKTYNSDNTTQSSLYTKAGETSLWYFIVLAAAIFCLYATPSVSQTQTHQIMLSAHEFEAWTFKPKPDDQIEITNHSDISHSIYITYPDGTVENLGVQTPGEKVSWIVPASGEYILQCWIHPVIRASLKVASSASIS